MEQQRIAVGRGFRHLLGADRTAGAADILHDKRLTEPLAELCANSRASMSVVPPAGNGTTTRMGRVG